MIQLGPQTWATRKLIEVGSTELWLRGFKVDGDGELRTSGLYLRADHKSGAELTPDEAFTLGTALVSWSERVEKTLEANRDS